ncbi:hypothetical protein [Ramlibacter sp.]|uniref:hypothetical protein n=1 Tax=Ramlibacter sp. TaxID=1917967 RepID=UPI003D0FF97B
MRIGHQLRMRKLALRCDAAATRARLARDLTDLGTAATAGAIGLAAARVLMARVPLRAILGAGATLVAALRALNS